MQNIQMLNAKKVSSKSKRVGFKGLMNEIIYTIGPGLLLLFLIFGSFYEWHYWKQILWTLFY